MARLVHSSKFLLLTLLLLLYKQSYQNPLTTVDGKSSKEGKDKGGIVGKNAPKAQMSKLKLKIKKDRNNEIESLMETMRNPSKYLNTRNIPTFSKPQSQLIRVHQLEGQDAYTNAAKLLTQTDDETVVDMLQTLIYKYLNDCDLIIGYRKTYASTSLLHRLSMLSNAKQVIQIESVENFGNIIWTSTMCVGALFLFVEPQVLWNFGNTKAEKWNYHGRYIFVGLSQNDLEALTLAKKYGKTEHIVSVTEFPYRGEWGLFTNLLFGETRVVRINTWKNNRFIMPVNAFPDKVSNLGGVTLKVSTFVWEPSVFYYKDDEGKVLFPYGLDIEVINTLAQALNFSVTFEEPPKDELWGEYAYNNNSWTGMIGMMQRDEADIGPNIYIDISYTDVLDFSKPYNLERSCVMLRKEPPLPRWQSLMFPFQPWTWFSVALTLLVTGPILFLLGKYTGRLGDKIEGFRSLVLSWQYTFSMLLRYPQTLIPTSISTQIYFAFLSIYCFLITVAYTTNLTAFLTVEKSPYTMETIKELADSGALVVGVDNFYQGMLLSSPAPHLQAMGQNYEIIPDSNEIFRHVESGRAVYIGNEGNLHFIILTKFTDRGVTNLRIMKECLASHSLAMALQRHSPLKKKFDQVISRMLSGGLTARFFLNSLQLAASTKEYGGTESKQGKNVDSVDTATGGTAGAFGESGFSQIMVPLSMEHLQGIFYVLILGLVISMLIFFIEIFMGKK